MRTINHCSAIFSLAAKGGLLFISLFALLQSSARAQCTQWDASGRWEMVQGPTTIDVNLHQQGAAITGTASIKNFREGTSGVLGLGAKAPSLTEVRGSVQGTVVLQKFHAEIHWQNQTIGIYDGSIKPDGWIEGATYEKGKSGGVGWQSKGKLKCAGTAAPATSGNTSTPLPLKMNVSPKASAGSTSSAPTTITGALPGNRSTGGPWLPRADSTSTPPRSTPIGPTIAARPNFVTVPAGQTQAKTALFWDAGKDHPYAEVWVKVDDQDETKIVEQGTGSRQVTVELGKTYLYILTDAGQRLATVVVKAK